MAILTTINSANDSISKLGISSDFYADVCIMTYITGLPQINILTEETVNLLHLVKFFMKTKCVGALPKSCLGSKLGLACKDKFCLLFYS